MAELVQHRAEPALARLDVREDADVVDPSIVDAERVLVLVVARIQVAAGEDVVDVIAERLEVGARDLERIEVRERRLERIVGRRRGSWKNASA